ncbi:MAG: ATP-binding cassette domain-containing protein [Desulfuromonadales bacterium]|nr:ATP-binding cassette domain-containing protein [Desulfuromonadales bacterium]
MISITGLNKTFLTPSGRVNALKDINLTVDKGDIFGIIGFSGAGKSTLIRCLNRLEEPDSGTIRIGAREITRLGTRELRAARKKIGMIFQHYYLLESRTVFGNVAFPLEIAGYPKQRIGHRAVEILELVGLIDKIGAYPAQLSGGQKQRVGIARALANEPDVLLSDEATSSLDPSTSRSILDLLRDINQKLGLTIVMITHEMDVLRYLCANAAVIEAGEIIETGSVAEISAHPRHEITRLFFAPSRQNSSGEAQGMLPDPAERGERKEVSDVR